MYYKFSMQKFAMASFLKLISVSPHSRPTKIINLEIVNLC